LPEFKANLKSFLDVCEIHGRAYAYHHDELVKKYIEDPAITLPETKMDDLTASGPPLPVLLRGLEKIRDLRLAADRKDIPTRYADLKKLRALL